jgi:hypothetical protein
MPCPKKREGVMNRDNIVADDPYVRNREADDNQYRSVQKDPSSPESLEEKTAAMNGRSEKEWEKRPASQL